MRDGCQKSTVEVRWQTLECCQVRMSFWPHLALPHRWKCLCECDIERDCVECIHSNHSCKHLQRKRKSPTTLVSQNTQSAQPKSETRSNSLQWTIVHNLYPANNPGKMSAISERQRKYCGPWARNVSLNQKYFLQSVVC